MKYFKTGISLLILFILAGNITAETDGDVIWLEAESFIDTGTWSNDSQYVDLMGSPYLLATGVGKPVQDAVTTAKVSVPGNYRLWVRCKDWLPEYHPGLFQVIINGRVSQKIFGKAVTDAWQWVDGGCFDLKRGKLEVRLHDLNGWWGRCDAIILAQGNFKPENRASELAEQRLKYCGVSPTVKQMGTYDVVVVGGGPSGLGAAISAARHGARVAFIQDRPVLGGNSSSEIQVPPMGYIGNPPDLVNVTGLAEELFPKQGWHNFADSGKMESIVRAERNISLFLNTRAYDVVMEKQQNKTQKKSKVNTIKSVLALGVKTGQRMLFSAPLFIDCTGHGWIGYYAGAEFRMGQEARSEFGESLAPVKPGKLTMGNCLYYAEVKKSQPRGIIKFSDKEKVTVSGDWINSNFNGGDYLHDGNTGKGSKAISFAVNVSSDGRYRIFLGFMAFNNRAEKVPVTISHSHGKTKKTVDQTKNVDGVKELGVFYFKSNEPGCVTISNKETQNYVVADFIQIIPEDKSRGRRTPSAVFESPAWAYNWKKTEDFEARGSHRRQRKVIRPENFDRPSRGKGRNPGNDINGGILNAWWVEYGGMSNIIDDAEKIRDELFRINIGLWNYAKNYNPVTVEKNRNRELVWLNYVPGVRESRRLIGDYIMTQFEYDERIVHDDTIGFTDWGPDVHHPEGFWVRGNDCIHVYQGKRTSIPYRTLYSKNISNLFMAGRCHSATHIAMGGTRVMRPLMQTGQAAGTAASIAGKYKTNPRGVYKKHIKELQQKLLKDGCYLLEIKNNDRDDLALTARVTASSYMEAMEPDKAVNGWNRVVGKDRNAWSPDFKNSDSHWLKFKLADSETINTVHVTSEKQCPDFQVEALVNNTWKRIAVNSNNNARRVVLNFESIQTDCIRIVAAEDSKSFILCEVRLYNALVHGYRS